MKADIRKTIKALQASHDDNMAALMENSPARTRRKKRRIQKVMRAEREHTLNMERLLWRLRQEC